MTFKCGYIVSEGPCVTAGWWCSVRGVRLPAVVVLGGGRPFQAVVWQGLRAAQLGVYRWPGM